MLETKYNHFEFQEQTLSPHVRIIKVVGWGFCLGLFVITLIIFGYRGRVNPFAHIPQVITTSKFAATTLIVLNIASIAGLFLFPRLKSIRPHQQIAIDGNTLRILVLHDHPARINLKQATKVSFKIMPLFHVLFNNQFHRIGRLSVIDKNRNTTFYFPVRNESIRGELSQFCKALQDE